MQAHDSLANAPHANIRGHVLDGGAESVGEESTEDAVGDAAQTPGHSGHGSERRGKLATKVGAAKYHQPSDPQPKVVAKASRHYAAAAGRWSFWDFLVLRTPLLACVCGACGHACMRARVQGPM
jgi:hypothetical protein